MYNINSGEMNGILEALEESGPHVCKEYTNDSVFAVCTISGGRVHGYNSYVHCLVRTFDEAVNLIETQGDCFEERWSVMGFIERHNVGPSFSSGCEAYWYKWVKFDDKDEASTGHNGRFVPVGVPKQWSDMIGFAF